MEKVFTTKVIVACMMYQLIPLLLVGGGIMVDVFAILGTSWNDTSASGDFSVVIGWLFLEVPIIMLLVIRGLIIRFRNKA